MIALPDIPIEKRAPKLFGTGSGRYRLHERTPEAIFIDGLQCLHTPLHIACVSSVDCRFDACSVLPLLGCVNGVDLFGERWVRPQHLEGFSQRSLVIRREDRSLVIRWEDRSSLFLH
jgi:hypothetical protein